MAYEKTTWVDGETEIDAQKLNKMEEGIVEASQTGGILTGSIVAYDGDTIPEGYEEVSSDGTYELTDTPSHSEGTNYVYIEKRGKLVNIVCNNLLLNSIAKNSWVTLGKISLELLPDYEPATIGVIQNAKQGTITGYGRIIISKEGNLAVKSSVAVSELTGITFSISWFLN